MIKIRNGRLPISTSAQLRKYQAEIDKLVDYADRVATAGSKFKSRNKKTNNVFFVVRDKLKDMCSGIARCMYCEDSVADEVEHHNPKALYPERAFVWRNYLYACGPCNGPKNKLFKVIDSVTLQLIDVTRAPKAPIIPPVPGAPALLDPRVENPLDFLMLDLQDTFYFTPRHAPGTIEYLRAEYTVEILRLNIRDTLVAARKDAYGGYRARLQEFILHRNMGAKRSYLAGLRAGFKTAPHATVWAEMKRQHQRHPALLALFAQAPEALAF